MRHHLCNSSLSEVMTEISILRAEIINEIESKFRSMTRKIIN